MFHVSPPSTHLLKSIRENGPLSPGGKIEISEHPRSPPPDFLGTWKIFEKFPAGSLLHDPMKEYVRNMKEYVGI